MTICKSTESEVPVHHALGPEQGMDGWVGGCWTNRHRNEAPKPSSLRCLHFSIWAPDSSAEKVLGQQSWLYGH